MKIIDLFDKTVNGEYVPLKIKYDGILWEFDGNVGEYFSYETKEWFIDKYHRNRSWRGFLNDEVEIIEEDKKIPEKIDQNDTKWEYVYSKKDNTEVITNLNILRLKINEIIDYLKSKGE